jgi:diaminopimelate epimerase
MKIKFTKMTGAGNDFVFLGPAFAGLKDRAPELARALCGRRTAVGADGLIIVDDSGETVFMHYYNSDGSEADFCGNGARCFVLYVIEKKISKGRMEFDSRSGRHLGEIVPEGVRVSMEAPKLVGDEMLDLAGGARLITLAEAGVPHAVLISEDVEAVDVENLGREIRVHPHFAPEGANADFVGTRGRDGFPIRTYERGVEKETLACGSGCVAAALVLRSKNIAGSRSAFRVASGDVLQVELPRKGEKGEAYLTGPARIVYEGEIDLKE